jgi:hypothetical protein
MGEYGTHTQIDTDGNIPRVGPESHSTARGMAHKTAGAVVDALILLHILGHTLKYAPLGLKKSVYPKLRLKHAVQSDTLRQNALNRKITVYIRDVF